MNVSRRLFGEVLRARQDMQGPVPPGSLEGRVGGGARGVTGYSPQEPPVGEGRAWEEKGWIGWKARK